MEVEMIRRTFETNGGAGGGIHELRPRTITGLLLVWALLAATGASSSSLRAQGSGEYDRPGKNPHQSRSAVIASPGIVCCAQPLAAEVGLDVLKAGGNAADAAIATNAMLGLV